jgi:predicted dehydrogenase
MSAHIRFNNARKVYISATLATPFISRFTVFGVKGWIAIRDNAHVESPADWVVTSATTGSPISTVERQPAEPVKENRVAFAHAVPGKAAYPITGEQLVNNISILEAIIKSAAEDGAVVTR